MYPKPWFEIVAVSDTRGRSMADITREVIQEFGVTIEDMKGPRCGGVVLTARREAWTRIRRERPDLSSEVVARFFLKDGSTVRHWWRRIAHERRLAA